MREKGREREGERERRKHWSTVPLVYSFIGWFLYVPWLRIELATLTYQDDTNWATQPRFYFSFLATSIIYMLDLLCPFPLQFLWFFTSFFISFSLSWLFPCFFSPMTLIRFLFKSILPWTPHYLIFISDIICLFLLFFPLSFNFCFTFFLVLVHFYS